MVSNNVSILKDDIKEKTQFLGNVDAKDLKLWHVNFPVDDLPSIPCPNCDPEINVTLLSELFQPVLDPKMVHVVVDVPDHPRSRHITEERMRDMVAALDLSACFLLFFDCP